MLPQKKQLRFQPQVLKIISAFDYPLLNQPRKKISFEVQVSELQTVGSLRADESVVVRPEVGGRITRILDKDPIWATLAARSMKPSGDRGAKLASVRGRFWSKIDVMGNHGMRVKRCRCGG